jgi:hypothetical protein
MLPIRLSLRVPLRRSKQGILSKAGHGDSIAGWQNFRKFTFEHPGRVWHQYIRIAPETIARGSSWF